MVNGAGLAMATMDIIKLTVRRRQTSSTSAAARPRRRSRQHQDHQSDPHVKGMVNIFGGIMRCDVVAEAWSRRCGKSA